MVGLKVRSHLIEEVDELFETGDLLYIPLPIILYLLHNAGLNTISVINVESHRNSICLEPASSSDSMEIVRIIWLFEVRVLMNWNIIVNDDVNCRDIDTSCENIGADESCKSIQSEIVNGLISLSVCHITCKDSCLQ